MYRCILGRSSQSEKSLLKASKDNFRFDNRVVSRNHAELFVDVIKKVTQLAYHQISSSVLTVILRRKSISRISTLCTEHC